MNYIEQIQLKNVVIIKTDPWVGSTIINEAFLSTLYFNFGVAFQ